MDTIKNIENDTNKNYLVSCQLCELIGDIERCATMLVEAAKKAKIKCDKVKNSYLEKIS